MFDIETIKQNAFIGFQEEFLRNNRVKQFAFSQNECHITTPISYTSASPHDSDVSRSTSVKLDRDPYHDTILQNFDHDQQSVSSNGSITRSK